MPEISPSFHRAIVNADGLYLIFDIFIEVNDVENMRLEMVMACRDMILFMRSTKHRHTPY